MTSSYWDSSKARGALQSGGAGFPIFDLGTETNVAAITGGGKSYESDFGRNGYVGTRATSNKERYTGDIMSRRTVISALRRLTERDCLSNLYLLYGCAEYPTLHNFESGVIYLDGGVTSRGVDQNLAQGTERFDPKTMDTVSYSYGEAVEIKAVTHKDISGTVYTEDIKKVIALNRQSCPGICGVDNDGNQEFIAIGDPISPATVANVLYTDDGGLTWSVDTISGAANVSAANAVTVAGELVLFALTGTNGGVYYTTLADIRAGTVTGTLANGIANGSSVTALFAVTPELVIAGLATGAVYASTDGGYSFSLISAAGAIFSADIEAIHGRDENLIYIVSDAAIGVYLNQSIVTALTDPSGGNTLLTVHVPAGQARGSEVFVGDNAGFIYHSRDKGVTWETKSFPLSGTGSIADIQSAGINSIAMFVVQTNVGGTASRVIRDLSGGAFGQYAVPLNEGSFTSPPNSLLTSIAPSDVNHAVTVGLINSTYGFIGKIEPA